MPQPFPDRKKWPQRKSSSRFLPKWIWQLCSEKDVCPCLWTCPFPPSQFPGSAVLYAVCLGRELTVTCPTGNGDGWETNPPRLLFAKAWAFSITFPLSYLKFNTPMVWVFPFLSVEARSAAALTCTCICIFTWTLLRLQDQIFQKHFVRIEITKRKSIVNKPLFWIHGFIFQALLYILFPVRCAGDYTVLKNEIFYRLWFWLSIFAFCVHPAKVN